MHIIYKHLKLEKAQMHIKSKMGYKLWNTQTTEYCTSVKMSQPNLHQHKQNIEQKKEKKIKYLWYGLIFMKFYNRENHNW